MIPAGKLTESVVLERRTEQGLGPWVEQVRRSARIQRLRAGEEIVARRMTGKRPAVITLRACSQTRAIGADWRVVDARTGESWGVKAVEPSEDRTAIVLVCERYEDGRGTADG